MCFHMQRVPLHHGGKLVIDHATGYFNAIEHDEETTHEIVYVSERYEDEDNRRHLSHRRHKIDSSEKKQMLQDCKDDKSCCTIVKIMGVEIMNRWCAYCIVEDWGAPQKCQMGELDDYPRTTNDHGSTKWVTRVPYFSSSYRSPSIYWPAGVECFEIWAEAEMSWDPAPMFSESDKYPKAQGCINIALACENFLTKKGMGWIAPAVCGIFTLQGSICVHADAMIDGKCKTGTKTKWYQQRESRCCAWHWMGWCTRNCVSYPWKSRQVEVYDEFTMLTRLGVYGTIEAGLDLWVAGIDVKAKIMWYVMAEQKGKMKSMAGKLGGNHIGVYVTAEGWVAWATFEFSFSAVPWWGCARLINPSACDEVKNRFQSLRVRFEFNLCRYTLEQRHHVQ
jgi:hypothetical protein